MSVDELAVLHLGKAPQRKPRYSSQKVGTAVLAKDVDPKRGGFHEVVFMKCIVGLTTGSSAQPVEHSNGCNKSCCIKSAEALVLDQLVSQGSAWLTYTGSLRSSEVGKCREPCML
jgi:hypothetical protein